MEYTKEVDTYYSVEKVEVDKDAEVERLEDKKAVLQQKITDIDAAIAAINAL